MLETARQSGQEDTGIVGTIGQQTIEQWQRCPRQRAQQLYRLVALRAVQQDEALQALLQRRQIKRREMPVRNHAAPPLGVSGAARCAASNRHSLQTDCGNTGNG